MGLQSKFLSRLRSGIGQEGTIIAFLLLVGFTTYLRHNYTNINKLLITEEGVNTCFNRVTKSFTSFLIVNQIKSVNISNDFINATQECFADLISETIPGTNGTKSLEKINKLSSEVNNFYKLLTSATNTVNSTTNQGTVLAAKTTVNNDINSATGITANSSANSTSNTTIVNSLPDNAVYFASWIKKSSEIKEKYQKLEESKYKIIEELDNWRKKEEGRENQIGWLFYLLVLLSFLMQTRLVWGKRKEQYNNSEVEREARVELTKNTSLSCSKTEEIMKKSLEQNGLMNCSRLFTEYNNHMLDKALLASVRADIDPASLSSITSGSKVNKSSSVTAGRESLDRQLDGCNRIDHRVNNRFNNGIIDNSSENLNMIVSSSPANISPRNTKIGSDIDLEVDSEEGMEAEKIDLGTILTEVVNLYSNKIFVSGIVLDFKIEDNLWTLGSEDRVKTIFSDVLNSAINIMNAITTDQPAIVIGNGQVASKMGGSRVVGHEVLGHQGVINSKIISIISKNVRNAIIIEFSSKIVNPLSKRDVSDSGSKGLEFSRESLNKSLENSSKLMKSIDGKLIIDDEPYANNGIQGRVGLMFKRTEPNRTRLVDLRRGKKKDLLKAMMESRLNG